MAFFPMMFVNFSFFLKSKFCNESDHLSSLQVYHKFPMLLLHGVVLV